MIRLYRRFVPNRLWALLMRTFSFISQMVNLLAPYFVGKMINAIQLGGADMRRSMITYLGLYTLVPFVSWLFHGTSRIWEQKLQFKTEAAYKLYLFKAVTSFGIPWHTENHSGETIDKIAKAVSGVYDFSGNMFMYLGTFI